MTEEQPPNISYKKIIKLADQKKKYLKNVNLRYLIVFFLFSFFQPKKNLLTLSSAEVQRQEIKLLPKEGHTKRTLSSKQIKLIALLLI